MPALRFAAPLLCLLFTLSSPARAAGAPERARLLVSDLRAGSGVDASEAAAMTDALVLEFSRLGLFQVVSSDEVRTLLGFERSRALLGCDESSTSSCLTELTGALGAALLVSGSVSRLGTAWQLTVQVLDAAGARALGRSARIAADLPSLREQLPWVAAEATGAPPPKEASKAVPALLLGAGAAAAVASGALFLVAGLQEQAAVTELALARTQPQLSLKPLGWYEQEAENVLRLRVIGGALAGVGLAALTIGAFTLAKAPRPQQPIALMVGPGGFVVAGVWP